ncbi:hypothetical protein [Couchioplanes azureus]|uniref:hypothetical protein n=1 Tax=Couchioplanes caeruleus TaxID=56438 RepID=UPI00167032B6|nr:hypothetical protein [Couchioplanes caeruleus]GGQ55024.1 hypothetical protein GCM10010166_25130 [Couchioplanes caeruleus subsp. azureus]
MTITTAPAQARTDVTTPAAAATSTRQVRRTGLAVAAGSLVWAASMAAVNPQSTDSTDILITDLGAIPFQLSLFALVTTQLRTAATGTSRLARGMLATEYVLLTLATIWTVLHGLVPAFRDDLWLAVLDAFWPLSMLGMFVIGAKIAFAGRWRGVARAWPLVAESWAVVAVPAIGILGASGGRFVGAAHLLVGYVALGLILALRPHLTTARD